MNDDTTTAMAATPATPTKPVEVPAKNVLSTEKPPCEIFTVWSDT